jgi:transposase
MKHNYPNWALEHRKPGTELRFINNTYYLYQVSAFYDPIKKKGRKKTGPLLGKITEIDGFVPSDKKTLKDKAHLSIDFSKISVREAGFTNFLNVYGKEIEDKLQLFFPKYYKTLIYMAYCRLVYNSPINRMNLLISKSLLSVDDKDGYYPKKFSDTLFEIGTHRTQCVEYMKSFVKSDEHILVDMTNMFNSSEKMYYSKEGYNSDMVFDTQINLMYIYSSKTKQPLFYKLLNGNTREVSGFKNFLIESGIHDAILIADKGFYSKANIELLEKNSLQYIIPLKRNDNLIDYSKLDDTQNSYFQYEDRIIWMTQYEIDGVEVKLYKDDKLRTQEQKDYLQRISSNIDGYSRDRFNAKLQQFGTFAIITNLQDHSLQDIYGKYKSRNSIELMFDGVKTILKADVSYMQKEETLNGWMFVNHIALQWYYLIYNILTEQKLLSKYSVKQFITELKEHRAVLINNDWVEETMTKSTKTMLDKLKIYSVNSIKS